MHYDSRSAAVVFNLGMGAHHYTALACHISFHVFRRLENHASGREIGSFDNRHEFFDRNVGVIHHHNAAVYYFAKIVRRNISGHTNGNTYRTVYKEIPETRRKRNRLHLVFIKIRSEINGILVDITHHLKRNLLKSCLSITVSSRRVSVKGTKVAVAVNQRMSLREVPVPVLQARHKPTHLREDGNVRERHLSS